MALDVVLKVYQTKKSVFESNLEPLRGQSSISSFIHCRNLMLIMSSSSVANTSLSPEGTKDIPEVVIVNESFPVMRDGHLLARMAQKEMKRLLKSFVKLKTWKYEDVMDMIELQFFVINASVREDLDDSFEPLIGKSLIKIWNKVLETESTKGKSVGYRLLMQDLALGRFISNFSNIRPVLEWTSEYRTFFMAFLTQSVVNPRLDFTVDSVVKQIIIFFNGSHKKTDVFERNKIRDIAFKILTSPYLTRIGKGSQERISEIVRDQYSFTGHSVVESSPAQGIPSILRDLHGKSKAKRTEKRCQEDTEKTIRSLVYKNKLLNAEIKRLKKKFGKTTKKSEKNSEEASKDQESQGEAVGQSSLKPKVAIKKKVKTSSQPSKKKAKTGRSRKVTPFLKKSKEELPIIRLQVEKSDKVEDVLEKLPSSGTSSSSVQKEASQIDLKKKRQALNATVVLGDLSQEVVTKAAIGVNRKVSSKSVMSGGDVMQVENVNGYTSGQDPETSEAGQQTVSVPFIPESHEEHVFDFASASQVAVGSEVEIACHNFSVDWLPVQDISMEAYISNFHPGDFGDNFVGYSRRVRKTTDLFQISK